MESELLLKPHSRYLAVYGLVIYVFPQKQKVAFEHFH